MAPGRLEWAAGIALLIGSAAVVAIAWSVDLGGVIQQLRVIGWWFAVAIGLDLVARGFHAGAIRVLGRGADRVAPSAHRAVGALVYCGIIGSILSLALVAIGALLMGALLTPVSGPLRWALAAAGLCAAAGAFGLGVLLRRGMLARIAHLHGRRDRVARRAAIVCVAVSKALGWVAIYVIVRASGYDDALGLLAAILSATVILALTRVVSGAWVAAPLSLWESKPPASSSSTTTPINAAFSPPCSPGPATSFAVRRAPPPRWPRSPTTPCRT